MIIIEHIATKHRFRYPSINDNKETYEGFIQTQYVPREFQLSTNQDPSGVPDYHSFFQENGQNIPIGNYPSERDPLNVHKESDKIW